MQSIEKGSNANREVAPEKGGREKIRGWNTVHRTPFVFSRSLDRAIFSQIQATAELRTTLCPSVGQPSVVVNMYIFLSEIRDISRNARITLNMLAIAIVGPTFLSHITVLRLIWSASMLLVLLLRTEFASLDVVKLGLHMYVRTITYCEKASAWTIVAFKIVLNCVWKIASRVIGVGGWLQFRRVSVMKDVVNTRVSI